MADILFVVNADLTRRPARSGPRKDYDALAQALGATVLDHASVARSRAARLLARWAGMPIAQAWLAFRARKAYRAILTDGEQVGIPLALLLKLARDRRPHVTIGHRIATRLKGVCFRWLRAHSHISRLALHSTLQHHLALTHLGIPAQKLELIPYQVDAAFWRPQPVAEEALVVSVGLEHRDYPTLFRAVEGLTVRVVVAAASHWSHQRNSAADAPPPPNVEIGQFDYVALRDLYARAALVVVPLYDVDFQAGVTTILEAMAMAKAVVVTRTRGQTDVVVAHAAEPDGQQPPPPADAESLIRRVARAEGVTLEPNGMYVPPGDPQALREAIAHLLAHPAERARLGASGRHALERLMTLEQFVQRVTRMVDAVARPAPAPAPPPAPAVRVPRPPAAGRPALAGEAERG